MLSDKARGAWFRRPSAFALSRHSGVHSSKKLHDTGFSSSLPSPSGSGAGVTSANRQGTSIRTTQAALPSSQPDEAGAHGEDVTEEGATRLRDENAPGVLEGSAAGTRNEDAAEAMEEGMIGARDEDGAEACGDDPAEAMEEGTIGPRDGGAAGELEESAAGTYDKDRLGGASAGKDMLETIEGDVMDVREDALTVPWPA
ncbi:hypothetical protein FRC10_000324 [Ceratobasidium sp. 414]|nr:hypothetical protein FRC10_000324 [Ceratobasidium sp. 414]